jgi:large subunit ribosomal protein L18
MAEIAKKRLQSRLARHARIRRKISGTAERPRLCVRRSLLHMVVQVVDDENNNSLVLVSTTGKEFQEKFASLNKVEQSKELGKLVAQKAKEKGIETVAFDRGGYIYHGRVKAVADGAREAGLQF